MDLFQLVLILVLIGVALGVLNYVAPTIMLDAKILRIINVLVVVCVVLWLVFLFLGPFPHIEVGNYRRG